MKKKVKIYTPEEKLKILINNLEGYIGRLEKEGNKDADTIFILKRIRNSIES